MVCRVSFQSNLESCFYFSYCDSLKNCASQFSENCVQTVNDNNSEAQSKFQQVRNTYAVNKDNTLQLLALEKGSWGRLQKIQYFGQSLKYARIVKRKIWSVEENGERDCGEMLVLFAGLTLSRRIGTSCVLKNDFETKNRLFCCLWLRQGITL